MNTPHSIVRLVIASVPFFSSPLNAYLSYKDEVVGESDLRKSSVYYQKEKKEGSPQILQGFTLYTFNATTHNTEVYFFSDKKSLINGERLLTDKQVAYFLLKHLIAISKINGSKEINFLVHYNENFLYNAAKDAGFTLTQPVNEEDHFYPASLSLSNIS